MSVEYRLAPEHPHPGLVDYAGLKWTADDPEMGFDPADHRRGRERRGRSDRGGRPAGRDRGTPVLLGQVLLCPMLDDRNDAPSSHQMAGLGVWDRAANHMGWTALLGDARGGPDVSPLRRPGPRRRPLRAASAFIDVGSARALPGRGRRLRERPVAGGRPGRTPRVARWLPRIRPDGAAGRPSRTPRPHVCAGCACSWRTDPVHRGLLPVTAWHRAPEDGA